MCGIAGQYFLTKQSSSTGEKVISSMKHRGPDAQDQKLYANCEFYHVRLSILDLSHGSDQPFSIGNKSIIYNGEIFNYKELVHLVSDVKSTGDVEVLFKLFDKEKTKCLDKLNGFFAFAFFDEDTDELIVVRDRYGEKPLYYYHDEEKLAFASELKPLLQMCGKQRIDEDALYTYLRLNYISGSNTIFKNIKRLLPGQYIEVKNKKITVSNWYKLPEEKPAKNIPELLSDAVKIRLHADVPVGCFLSGGLDSSIISALAKQQHKDLHTFSLGFRDEVYFDETAYAESVAKHIGSTHHVFKLTNTDLFQNIDPFLKSIDEPFADSSAFNVFVLSKYTRQHVKVALSGDGADELFMGYNKHKAEWLSGKFFYRSVIPAFSGLLSGLPASRNSGFGNKLRQLKRFSDSASLGKKERYINWACISTDEEVKTLMKSGSHQNYFNQLFSSAFSQSQFNEVNLADLNIVLSDDMLVKADRMSMRHGLEIRSPFMDHRIVELAMNLEQEQKINSQGQKFILRNSFKHLLPPEIFSRGKKGFEMPLWKWMNTELKNDIENKWLSKPALEEHGLFNMGQVNKLKQDLFSKHPGDSAAKIWALVIFQNWYSNFREFIL